MIKNHLGWTVALGLSIGLGACNTAQAADGTINFTGSILDSGCTVDTGSASQTVDLGRLAKSSFTGAGSTAGSARFDIVVSECPDTVQSAAVTFDGSADPTNPSLLALTTGADTASGVGVALYEVNGSTLIPMHTASRYLTLDTSTGTSNTLSFVAKYMATAEAVSAGQADASTSFTIVYQ